VKCRKCGDQIVVLKDAEPGPVDQPREGEGSLDLGSALREPPDNLIPFPKTPSRTVEPPETPAKDEVDLAFEQLLSRTPEEAAPPAEPTPAFEAPTPPVSEPPAEPTFEAPTPPAFEPPAELTFEAPTPPAFEPPAEPTFEAPPAELAIETTSVSMPGVSEKEEWDIGESPLEIQTAGDQALPSLKEEDRPPGIGEAADISLAISPSPPDLEASLQIETSAYPAAKEEERAPASEGIAVEGNVTPPSEAGSAEAPGYPAGEHPEPAVRPVPPPDPSREPAGTPVSRPSGPSFGLVAGIVLALALAAAVGYFGFTASGKRLAESRAPWIREMLGGSPGAAVSRYETKEIGYLVGGASSPRIFVIKGQVTNRSSAEKSGIRILASLLDNTGAVLMEETVYAGNVVSGEKLKTENRETLRKALANPLGEHLMNMDVPPGKSIPFMVLFFDAPENIDSYKLEAKDGT
jgi:hypothetical protein